MRALVLISALGCSALGVSGCATGRGNLALAAQQEQQHQQRLQLETRVAALDVQAAFLRAELDSLRVQNDSLRRSALRLEADLRDREEQLRAIRLELQRLKEIDLKPRKP